MKKTAILTAFMVVLASTTVLMSGCHKDTKASSSATEPSATPIATVAPTKAPTQAPTAPTSTQPSTGSTGTTQEPTQSATFNTQIATGTMPATVPTGTEVSSTTATQIVTSEYPTEEEPATTPYVPSNVSLEPDDNGYYTLTGTVTGYGSHTVVIAFGDGNEYEFNYENSGVSSSELYDGATITVVADGDPSGAGVPNAVQLYIG